MIKNNSKIKTRLTATIGDIWFEKAKNRKTNRFLRQDFIIFSIYVQSINIKIKKIIEEVDLSIKGGNRNA